MQKDDEAEVGEIRIKCKNPVRQTEGLSPFGSFRHGWNNKNSSFNHSDHN
jgi:hypothetical protein